MSNKPDKPRLQQEIALALTLKTIALIAIWLLWFYASEDQVVDTKQVASHIFPRQPAKK